MISSWAISEYRSSALWIISVITLQEMWILPKDESREGSQVTFILRHIKRDSFVKNFI